MGYQQTIIDLWENRTSLEELRASNDHWTSEEGRLESQQAMLIEKYMDELEVPECGRRDMKLSLEVSLCPVRRRRCILQFFTAVISRTASAAMLVLAGAG